MINKSSKYIFRKVSVAVFLSAVLLTGCHDTDKGTADSLQETVRLATSGDNPSIDKLTELANKGDAEAQYHLGLLYFQGNVVPLSVSDALKLFDSAANQNNADAQLNLGILYASGLEVRKDVRKAILLIQDSAKNGNAQAQYLLGAGLVGISTDVLNANAFERNQTEAVNWLEKSAQQNNALAQNTLAGIYLSANGVQQDTEKAVQLFQKAANQGLAVAQYNLAVLYESGTGLSHNDTKAMQFLQASAQQGYPEAVNRLKQIAAEAEAKAAQTAKAQQEAVTAPDVNQTKSPEAAEEKVRK